MEAIITLKRKYKVKTKDIKIVDNKIKLPELKENRLDIEIVWDVLKFYAKDCKKEKDYFVSKEASWRH